MNLYARLSRVKKSAILMVGVMIQESSPSVMEEPQQIAWKVAKMTTLHLLNPADHHRKVTLKMVVWPRRIMQVEGEAGPL